MDLFYKNIFYRDVFYMDLFYKGRCSIRINSVGICSIRDLVRPYSMGVYSIGAVFRKDLFYKDLCHGGLF